MFVPLCNVFYCAVIFYIVLRYMHPARLTVHLLRLGRQKMLAMRFVRLIEAHFQKLTIGLVEQIRTSERTSDFRKIPAEELQLAVRDVYRNLGEWLLQKTEGDISLRFRTIAARRASQGIRLHHLVWALMLTRDHLFRFLQREAFADNVFELHGELELHQLLNQFFDRALYYATLGYAEAEQQAAKANPRRARNIAASLGLISSPEPTL
jgi:hypothetical protein